MSNRQPPVMTAAHADALRLVRARWPYPTIVDASLIDDVIRHLDSLNTAPVPTKSNIGDVLALVDKWIADPEPDPEFTTPEPLALRTPDDWRTAYRTLDPELYQSDQ